jgi:ABC-type polysaccharide/polyol phosphate transport system ATPase subunit
MAAIELENVSKSFRVTLQPTRSLKEAFVGLVHRRAPHEEFVALRDVSLSVEPGEAVGVIGANGSGKSTLFKLISRILQPSSGSVRVRGRISPLIELSAGFHPELTGIENLYLNGAIYSMTREAVSAKIERIRAFADIGDFVFSPVRVYSSGMMARLAFALAINVDADILLIDEVLAVGDAAFQGRCRREVKAMNERGVTTVFVSHDLTAVSDLTRRVVWLDRGVVRGIGAPAEIIAAYTESVNERAPAAVGG